MESIFRPELQGSTGVIRTMDYIRAKNYKGRRFFMENENILYDCHNIPYAVSTQWSRNNLPAVIALAKSLGFDTSPKEDGQTQVSQSPQSTKPEGQIECVMRRGGIYAKGLFNPDDNSVIVLKGSTVNLQTSPSYNQGDKTKRERIISQYCKRKEDFIYVEDDIVFDTPSAASSFCCGSSSNGWAEWKDKNNNRISIYKQS